MPIIETKLITRPNTSVEFFNLSSDPALVQAQAAMGYTTSILEKTDTYIKKSNADGSMVTEITISNDGLLETLVVTFADLATYSHVETCLGINLDYAFKTYVENDDFAPPTGQQYTQSGITQPFSCTTTYTYDSNVQTAYPLFNSFINVIEASDNLVSLTNDGSVITAVHNYDNSEDFTTNHWLDYYFIEGLHSAGITRTTTYALL